MQEENKTVDIDTSGPAVDVELPEEKENTNVQTDNDTTNTVNTSSESSDTSPSVEEEKVETKEKKEEELEKYSESVQRRIAKLTHKWREAERQKDEALTYAQSQIRAKEEAEKRISKLEPSFMKSTEDSIVEGLKTAKGELVKAREAGYIDAEVAAQAKKAI